MWLRVAGYVTVTVMIFDKQSNACRTAVESKSNRSCNHRIIGFNDDDQRQHKMIDKLQNTERDT